MTREGEMVVEGFFYFSLMDSVQSMLCCAALIKSSLVL